MVGSYFLRSTPRYILILLFIDAALYLASAGVKAVARLAGFMLLPPLAVIIMLLVFGMFNVDLVNVKPVFMGRPLNWLLGGIDQFMPLYPATTAFYYLHFFRDSKSVLKVSLAALGTILPIFFSHAFGAIGSLSPSVIKVLAWPGVEFFHIIDIPFFLLEQGGLIFVITWYSLQYIAASQAFFSLGNQWHSAIGKGKERFYIWLSVLIALPLLLYPLEIPSENLLTYRYVTPAVLVNMLLFIITWAVAVSRRPKDVGP